jgi:hypothetical protein
MITVLNPYSMSGIPMSDIRLKSAKTIHSLDDSVKMGVGLILPVVVLLGVLPGVLPGV